MATAVAVKDAAFRDRIASKGFLDRLNHQVGFHVFGYALCQYYATLYVFDLAKVIKSFSGSDVTDVTRENFKRGTDIQVSGEVEISVAARFPAVCQASLPPSDVDTSKPLDVHVFTDLIKTAGESFLS